MDFTARAPHLPAPGETVMGGDFHMTPGGKGANQANAAARLLTDGRVHLCGRVGYDAFADTLRASLSAAGVDTAFVEGTQSAATGAAMIYLDQAGQNSILVAPGANLAVDRSFIETLRPLFRRAAYVLFQLETPLDAVAHGLRIAKEEGALTILDPAPAQPLSRALLECVDLLTPNETEAAMLSGESSEPTTVEAALLAMGARGVILKLGQHGCFHAGEHVPSFIVDVVDTTVAGDTFNAALAVALTEEKGIGAAMRFANAAAALSVAKSGAQTSAPSRSEVDDYCSRLP